MAVRLPTLDLDPPRQAQHQVREFDLHVCPSKEAVRIRHSALHALPPVSRKARILPIERGATIKPAVSPASNPAAIPGDGVMIVGRDGEPLI